MTEGEKGEEEEEGRERRKREGGGGESSHRIELQCTSEYLISHLTFLNGEKTIH